MRTIESLLKEELYELKELTAKAKKRLEKAPEGQLRVRKRKNVEEFYYRNGRNGNERERRENGRYLKKDEIGMASRLAQRDYDVCFIRKAEERIKAMDRFLKLYDKTSLKKLYQKINPQRKKLIVPAVLSDEEFVRLWESVEYKGKSFEDDENVIITDRGERVRSKSEKIIADKLNALGIPYRYEYPLILEGGVKIYPDFTILRMSTREEVYLEHFGMMDDMNYVEKAIYKLNTYEKNQIYLGVNLFVTYETRKKPISTKTLDDLIRTLFLEEK